MTEDEVNAFITDNLWEAFEYKDTSYVWGLIEAGAESLATFLTKKGVEVTR